LEAIGDVNRAVGVLILFNESGEYTACSESGAVKGMDVLDFTVGAFNSDHTAASLVVAGVRDGGNLLIAIHRGDIDFDIIGTSHRRGAILSGEFNGTEVEAETLNEGFSVRDEFFEGFVRLFGEGILHHFDFVELMAADHTAFIGAIGACLAAEARGIAEILFREIGLGQDLVAVEGDEGGFSGGEHKAAAFILGGLKPIDLILEFRELTGGETALIAEHMRDEHKAVSVGDMEVDEVVKDSPFEAGAETAVDPESVAREFSAALVVDKSEIGADIDVIFRLEIEGTRLAEVAEGLIVFLAAGEKIAVGEVRQGEEDEVEAFFEVFEFLVVGVDDIADLLHTGEDRRDVLPFLFIYRDLFGGLVLLGFESLDSADDLAAFSVERDYVGDIGSGVLSLGFKTGDHLVGIFLDVFDVDHSLFSSFRSRFADDNLI